MLSDPSLKRGAEAVAVLSSTGAALVEVGIKQVASELFRVSGLGDVVELLRVASDAHLSSRDEALVHRETKER